MAAGSLQMIGAPGHSPALKYELQLAEIKKEHGKGANAERIDLTFFILDELIPQFGVYQRVMKMLRQELYTAVYNDEYTAGIGKGRRSAVEPVRVPYFMSTKKIMSERDKQVSKYKDQVENLKEQLYNCEADLEKASSALESSKHTLREYETKVQSLTQSLQSTTEERDDLKLLVTHHNAVVLHLKEEGEKEAAALQENIDFLESEITELEIYKATHQNLQKAFTSKRGSIATTSGTVSTTASTTTVAKLERNQSHSTCLIDQLLVLQNKLIDQYELDIMSLSGINKEKNKLKLVKEKFKCNMELIETELSLLIAHQSVISSRSDHLSSLSPSQSHQAIIKSDHPASPLVSQEQVLNKYSAMMFFSSDSGQSYYPLKEAIDCLSCGEKVVVCPHWSESELIIQLPLHSTHLKLTHPSIQKQAPPIDNTLPLKQKAKVKETTTLNEASIVDPDFENIWCKFNSLYSIRRLMAREMTTETVLFLVKMFYVSQLKVDAGPPTQIITPQPLCRSFYQFMKSQYHTSNVGILATHDLLNKLQGIYQQNIVLRIFSHVLGGSLEPVVFRYFLLISDFLDSIVWERETSSDDSSHQSNNTLFVEWLKCVYPFLDEEALEQYSIEFIGHSQNNCNKLTILEYILWLVMRTKEPLVNQMESQLSEQKTLHPGSMSEHEFAEFSLSLCPSQSTDLLAVRLYSQALAQLEGKDKEGIVPIGRLAYILSYINLLHSSDIINDKLRLIISRGGDKEKELGSTDIDGEKKKDNNEVLKMSDIKEMTP